jgi:lysophospholipase L1-like esterase
LLACADPVFAQPTLSIARAGNQFVLSWPASATNYVLQSTTNLASAGWVTVSNVSAVTVSNSFNVNVTNSFAATFFRLRSLTMPAPTGLWLELPPGGVAPGALSVVLHNTAQGQPYDILTNSDLKSPAPMWNVARTIFGSADSTSVQIPMSGQGNGFVLAGVGEYERNALWYCDAVGIRSQTDRHKMIGFTQTLLASGLFSNLVDAAFLRTNLQPMAAASGQPQTFFGHYGTNLGAGTIRWDSMGFFLNGTNQWVVFPTPPVTNFTLFVVYKQDPSYTNSNKPLYCFENQAGAALSSVTPYIPAGMGQGMYDLIHSGQGWEFQDNWFQDMGDQPPFSDDYRLRTLGYGMDVTTSNVVRSIDGVMAPPFTATVAPITNLNVLTLGKWDFNEYQRAYYIGWVLFNRQLTAGEHAAVFNALRWLEPNSQNVVLYGDSLTFVNPDRLFNIPWGYQAFEANGRSNLQSVYNSAYTGTATAEQLYYLSKDIYNLRPGGAVAGSTLFIWGGMNDCLFVLPGGATTAFLDLSNMWTQARQWGFKVVAFTIQAVNSNTWSSPPWTPDAETMRTNLNALILANPRLYDSLIRADLLLDSKNTNLFFDGIHPNAAGNAIIASNAWATLHP